MLDKVMSELRFSQSGAIDPESAQHVGKIVGVEAIVTGSITDLQSYVGVNCRLINTETGRIFGAAQTKIVKDADLQKIIEQSMAEAAAAPAAQSKTPPVTPTRPSQPQPSEKVVDGISFQLRDCKAAGGTVTCSFMITNLSQEDRDFKLYAKYYSEYSVLIDDQNNEHLGGGSTLGLYSKDDGEYVENTLVPGIALKASVKFANIPETVTGIRLLRVLVNSGRGDNKVDYRDLPLTR